MYKPQATLFWATLYFKNTLYSVARGFAVTPIKALHFVNLHKKAYQRFLSNPWLCDIDKTDLVFSMVISPNKISGF